MHHWRTDWKSDYTRAREARIRRAMAFYETHEQYEGEEYMRRSGERISQVALGAFYLMPVPLIFGGGLGLSLVLLVAGSLFILVGSLDIVNAGRLFKKNLDECFALADQEQPRLAEMIGEYKREGLYETWSKETL